MKAMSRVALLPLLILITSVTGLGQPKETRQHRIIPLRPLSQDFEVIYGDPEAVGEPFVMRIRELPGTIIPPHKHPVDEHITVVQGTIYFAVGEKFDRAAMKEIKTGGYAFIPKESTMLARSFRFTASGRFTSTGVPGIDGSISIRRSTTPTPGPSSSLRRVSGWSPSVGWGVSVRGIFPAKFFSMR